MTHGDGGKGSGRRKEDASKIRDNWDLIFGKGKTTMNEEYEHDDEQVEEEIDETEGRSCPVCRGDMVVTATGMYLFCDTCGHREELVDDDYL
jgi:hypothetical protein